MGNIRLYGSTSGYTELAPPAVAPDGVLSLPTGTGTLATQASVGLVKIVDQSFTAVSTFSVNNCFSSTYASYLLVGKIAGSAGNIALRFRYRASGTDYTTTNYYSGGFRTRVNGTTATWNDSAADYSVFTYLAGSTLNSIAVNISDPYIAAQSAHHGTVTGSDATTQFAAVMGGYLDTTSLYDGFTLYTSSGTMTGTIRIYGYQN